MSGIERIKCGQVNCYLIKGHNGDILVDTGTNKYRDYLLDRLKDSNIKLIILTHGHIDHICNTKEIADKFNAKIAMHKNDYMLIKDNTIREIYCHNFWGKILKKLSENSMKTNTVKEFEPDIFLEDGESLNIYGIKGKIILLKGHTKGSIGILIDDDKLIAGDTLMNYVKASKALIAENFAELRKSLTLIEKSKVNHIYVGHGKMIEYEKFFR